MPTLDLESAVLEFVARPGYRPMKPKIIAKQLKLTEEEAIELRRLVKKMMRRGLLQYGANHLVMPLEKPPENKKTEKKAEKNAEKQSTPTATPKNTPAERPRKKSRDKQSLFDSLHSSDSSDTSSPSRSSRPARSSRSPRVVGVFQRTQKGFGFVRLSLPEEIDSSKQDIEREDVYIAADKTGDASTGDTVAVQLLKGHRGGPGPRGEIVEILHREKRQFVGTYLIRGDSGYVQVDGSVFTRPIYVGDPGAKGAKEDDKVVFEMLRFPAAYRDGEGVITEVLGPHGASGVDTLSILREFDLPDRFPDNVLDEARREAEKFDENSLDGRRDFTAETIITIDPADARDFDDAISLERTPKGDWRLGVHIADVSHFVRPKSALDREAYDRATSVYLPDRVIPMLPEVISNGLASLQPEKTRFVKTAYMEFTPEGIRTSCELYNGAIRSAKRFTYEQVDAFLADPEACRKKLDPKVFDLLGRMRDLGRILRARRMKQGALELDMPEVKIDLDDEGRVSGAHVSENTESHQMIEEFMLAANIAVAETLFSKQWHFLRRVHPAPSPRKMRLLTEFVQELGYKASRLEDRFELQKLLRESSTKPERHAVHYATLRSLQRAIYSPAEEGHYALAADCYCHFTSPIRRYPDLTIHRLVDAYVARRKPVLEKDRIFDVGRHCSDREQRAEAAERELTKMKLLAYLSERIGLELDGVITGVEAYGFFVQGVELPAEGLVRMETLADDFYRFDRESHTLAGSRAGHSYRLGDKVKVVVARVDMQRRQLDLRLADSKRTKEMKGAKEIKAAPSGKSSRSGGKPTKNRGVEKTFKGMNTEKKAKKSGFPKKGEKKERRKKR